ncbi:CCA tRNA nucleotidyltransferase [Melghiribacillus thermohalophilus]|nr:CCA tRNA nucleotidyltransferase [Melghiribacillus thermohalophilus]
MEQPFKEALPILHQLEKQGHQAYFVGGSVRDYLLKRPIGDIDIATSALPREVQSIFKKTIPVGIEHGTVLVRYHNQSYEVTTFRIDGDYQDFRHPEQVEFVRDIQEDLARRDFTINAIAMDSQGNIIDPFNGMRDMKEKLLRTVLHADDRFQEDPLRMMRAVRFISQLGFHLDDHTKKAMKKHGFLLEKIAVERKAAELEKLLKGTHLQKSFQVIKDTGIHFYLPVFQQDSGLIDKCLEMMTDPVETFYEGIARLHFINTRHSVEEWIREWKLSNKIKNRSKQLARAYQCFKKRKLDNRCLYLLDLDMIPSFVSLINAFATDDSMKETEVKKRYDSLPIYSRKDLKVDGNQIRQWLPDKKPGPWINTVLTHVENKVLTGELKNDVEQIKEWVFRWNRQEGN